MKNYIKEIKHSITCFDLKTFLRKSEFTPKFSIESVLTFDSLNPNNYKKNPLSFIPEINAYAAFNYEIVKEILCSSDFGISPIHRELNATYFQENLEFHTYNKRVAIQYLHLLSKFNDVDSFDIKSIYEKLQSRFSKQVAFDLIPNLFQPILFKFAISKLKIECMFPFENVESNSEIDNMVMTIDGFFQNRLNLEIYLKEKISIEGIPQNIINLLDSLKMEKKIHFNEIPHFLATLMYVIFDSLSSFLSSLFFFLFKENFKESFCNEKYILDLANEILRLYPPNRMIYRSAKCNMNFHGTALKKNDLIVLFIDAANRDDKIFSNPDQIEFNRIYEHLSFGRGQISCIGELESFRIAKKIINTISSDFKKLELIDKEPVFGGGPVSKLVQIMVIYKDV